MAHLFVDDGRPSNELSMDEIQAPPSPTAAVRHKRAERSCIFCLQRKIRCDKRSICACLDVLYRYPIQNCLAAAYINQPLPRLQAVSRGLSEQSLQFQRIVLTQTRTFIQCRTPKSPPGEVSISETQV